MSRERCPECDSAMTDFGQYSVCQYCDTVVSATIWSNWTAQDLPYIPYPWDEEGEPL